MYTVMSHAPEWRSHTMPWAAGPTKAALRGDNVGLVTLPAHRREPTMCCQCELVEPASELGKVG